MSSSGNGDFESDLITAKERDLEPLLEESVEALELDYCQGEEMEVFLNQAWFSGSRASHDHLRARAMARGQDPGPVDIEPIEAEFKALMEESADSLNLSVNSTIAMWALLGQAWIAGIQTWEAEIMGKLLETRSDVAQEALQWLESKDQAP